MLLIFIIYVISNPNQKELETRGYIYKGKYEGWYSVSDESFLGLGNVEDKVQPDGSVIKVRFSFHY